MTEGDPPGVKSTAVFHLKLFISKMLIFFTLIYQTHTHTHRYQGHSIKENDGPPQISLKLGTCVVYLKLFNHNKN